MQAGDVSSTWADTSLLEHLTGYKPRTNIHDGVSKFVTWYKKLLPLTKKMSTDCLKNL